MNGLLDFVQTPEGQGLLAAVAGGLAGAGRGTPLNNIGRAGVAGLVGYSTAYKDKLDRDEKEQMTNLRKQMFSEMGDGTPAATPFANAPTAMAQGAQAGSIGPTVQNAALMDALPPAAAPKTPGLSLPTLQKAAILGFKNVEPLFNMYKYQTDGVERKPGTFYRNPTTGQQEYINDPTKGFDYDPTTRTVTPIAGYNETIAGQEGAKTTATERAKANFALLPLGYAGPDGRPIGGTVGNYINGLGNPTPAPSAPAAPSAPRGMSQRPDGFPTISSAEQQGRDAERLRILSDERAKETNPTNQAALDREIASTRSRLQGSGGIAAAPTLQSEAEKTAQIGTITGRQGTQNELNKNWITNSYNPIVEQGRAAASTLASLDALKNIDIKTGWGTEAKANAAAFLSSMGIATKNAEMFAANAQKFQSVAMDRLLTNLQAQKGPQTEGDSTRAQAVFAQLNNTPQANAFIADFARAQANYAARKSQFYQEALPIAQQNGDLNEIDRRWSRISGSIWSDPILQKWSKK